MPFGALGENLDVAQLTLYGFWIFFFGLVFWLRREDRREGYPVETENTGFVNKPGVIMIPKPKEFLLEEGGSVHTPNFDDRDNERPFAAEKVNGLPGAPYEPTGDPMADGVGPAAFVPRRDEPERTLEGHVLIVPMRELPEFYVPKASTDPRGFDVVGADREKGGTVKEIWVDRADQMIRYLEVELTSGEGTVLLPMALARLNKSKKRIEVASIMAGHFANVPKLANSDQVTAAEEERVAAYYAGGRLYAHPSRLGPVI